MPFNFRETVGGLNHLRLKLERKLFNRPADHYLKRLTVPDSIPPLPMVSEGADAANTCPICGFYLARLDVSGGWLIETCSATGLALVLRRPEFKKRLLDLFLPTGSDRQSEPTPVSLPNGGR